MAYLIRDAREADAGELAGIFNSYAGGWATFFDEPLSVEAFQAMHQEAQGYPSLVAEGQGRLAGYALLRPFHFSPLMRRAAMTSCFLRREERGRGLGTLLLEALQAAAAAMGVDNLIAPVISRNAESLAFHERRGFAPCGRVDPAGRKFGRDFGVVFLQKKIGDSSG